MTKKYNICIVQPSGFTHSLGWMELAELICNGLKGTGIQAEITVNTSDPLAINVIIGAQLIQGDGISAFPIDSIILNVEQLGNQSNDWTEKIIHSARESDFAIWDYSERNLDYLRRMGIEKIMKLELGFDIGLIKISPQDSKSNDFIFYGSINHRRLEVLNKFKTDGLEVRTLYNIFGAQRDLEIARSKIALNIHYFESEIFEVVRANYLIHNKVPILAEINPTTFIEDDYRKSVFGAPRSDLTEMGRHLIGRPEMLAEKADQAFELLYAKPQSEIMKHLVGI